MITEDFYKLCDEIVGVESEYKQPLKIYPKTDRDGNKVQPMTNASRWGGREPGNGRYEGYGLIRVYNASCIHITFKNPNINNTYDSFDEALKDLTKAFE